MIKPGDWNVSRDQLKLYVLICISALCLNIILSQDGTSGLVNLDIDAVSDQYPNPIQFLAEVYSTEVAGLVDLSDVESDYLLLAMGPFNCASCADRYNNCIRIRDDLVSRGLSVAFAFVWWTPTIEYGLTFLQRMGISKHTYLMKETERFFSSEPSVGLSITILLDRQHRIVLFGSPEFTSLDYLVYIDRVLSHNRRRIR